MGRHQISIELFDIRHAQTGNIVERLIGRLKRRFKIVRTPIECEYTIAKAAIVACAGLHNLIRSMAPNDYADDLHEHENCGSVEKYGGNDNQAFTFDFASARS